MSALPNIDRFPIHLMDVITRTEGNKHLKTIHQTYDSAVVGISQPSPYPPFFSK
jgi:hypothetical protein